MFVYITREKARGQQSFRRDPRACQLADCARKLLKRSDLRRIESLEAAIPDGLELQHEARQYGITGETFGSIQAPYFTARPVNIRLFSQWIYQPAEPGAVRHVLFHLFPGYRQRIRRRDHF